MKDGSVHKLYRQNDTVLKIPHIKDNKDFSELEKSIEIYSQYLGKYFIKPTIERSEEYGYILKQKYINGREYNYKDFKEGVGKEQLYDIIRKGKNMENKEEIYFDIFGFDGIINYEFNNLSYIKKILLKGLLNYKNLIGNEKISYMYKGEQCTFLIKNTIEALKNKDLPFSNILIDQKTDELCFVDFSGFLNNAGRQKLKNITNNIIEKLLII